MWIGFATSALSHFTKDSVQIEVRQLQLLRCCSFRCEILDNLLGECICVESLEGADTVLLAGAREGLKLLVLSSGSQRPGNLGKDDGSKSRKPSSALCCVQVS